MYEDIIESIQNTYGHNEGTDDTNFILNSLLWLNISKALFFLRFSHFHRYLRVKRIYNEMLENYV